MNKLSILLLMVLAAVTVAQDELPFADAVAKYGVKFANEDEKSYSQGVYSANVKSIRDNNANPNSTHKEGVNLFAFLTRAEFKAKYLGAIPPKGVQVAASTPTVGWSIPTPTDWTTVANVVTPVRNQGQCGSCWAFAVVGALESLRFQGYRVAGANFAEQQLVDCSSSYGNQGCNGGWPTNAFNYVKAKGITTESAYPYTSGNTRVTGTCKTVTVSLFKISGYTNVAGNCDSLAAAVKLKPVVVAVDATNWSPYRSGIFSNCAKNINHAVLLVGVTSTTWKIKNSWDTWWGETGYMRLYATGGANTCAICAYGSYPIK